MRQNDWGLYRLTGFESQLFQVNPLLRASGLSSVDQGQCHVSPTKENCHTGWKVHSRGPKYLTESELPGEVQELLREVVNNKKESDQSMRERVPLAEVTTHTPRVRTVQSHKAPTQVLIRRWKAIYSTSSYWVPLHTRRWRQNHEQEGPCPHGAYSVVRGKDKWVKSNKWSSGNKQGAVIMWCCFTYRGQ